jgi:allantoinase
MKLWRPIQDRPARRRLNYPEPRSSTMPVKNAQAWPNGKRIAIAVSVMLETWAEGKWVGVQAQRSSYNPGVKDNQSITWGEYGGKSGIWRLLRILDEHGVPATFCSNAKSVEIYPEASAQVIRSGHDFAAHGYTQDQVLVHMTPDEEKAQIRLSLDVIGERTGKRPVGWLSPSLAWTEHTDGILAAEKLLWHGDANYTDLPRRVTTPNGPIAHIPHSDYTDNRVLWLSPARYYDTYKDTFDYLYDKEPLSLLVLTMHCHFSGRPLMGAVIDKLFRYFAQFPDVWYARHTELAEWALAGEADEVSNAERFFPR